jgi:outer membrane murein-binding lipoprotein Lpp
MGGEMKKAAILGALALLVLVTALLAGPALSSPSSQKVTIKSLARQVNALKRQVNTLKGQVAAAQSAAGAAQGTANSAQSIAVKLDGCLSRSLPVTRYGDTVGSDAATMFSDYDQDVLGYVPNIVSGSWYFTPVLDVTNTGGSADYYLAIVEPSCAGGFRMESRVPAQPRR